MRVFLFVLGLLLAGPVSAAVFLTEDNPPYSYQNAGRVDGISTAIVTEMARRAQVPARVELYPWSRALALAQTLPDACVFSAVRSPARETQFRWIGPIGTSRWALFARDDFMAPLPNLDAARRYQVGVANRCAQADWLRAERFDKLELTMDDRATMALLSFGRIDLWLTGLYKGLLLAAETGNRVRPVWQSQDMPYYLACHPAFPVTQAAALQTALDQMQQDGTVQRLVELHSRPTT